MSKLGKSLIGLIAAVAFILPAFAQEGPNPQQETVAGKVVSIDGPPGSVLVMRGAQSYALSVGDTLFANDQVFTRTNGAAKLNAYNCDKDVGQASSITLTPQFCQAALITLASSDTVGGIAIGAAAGGGGVGATPALLALLAAGGGAAALGNGGNGSPVSP